MPQDIHVPITGLQVRRLWHIPSFWSHAMESMAQARNEPGNFSVDARTINGVHHRAYLIADPHLEAMRLFPGIETTEVVGRFAKQAPDRSEVHANWLGRGRIA